MMISTCGFRFRHQQRFIFMTMRKSNRFLFRIGSVWFVLLFSLTVSSNTQTVCTKKPQDSVYSFIDTWIDPHDIHSSITVSIQIIHYCWWEPFGYVEPETGSETAPAGFMSQFLIDYDDFYRIDCGNGKTTFDATCWFTRWESLLRLSRISATRAKVRIETDLPRQMLPRLWQCWWFKSACGLSKLDKKFQGVLHWGIAKKKSTACLSEMAELEKIATWYCENGAG